MTLSCGLHMQTLGSPSAAVPLSNARNTRGDWPRVASLLLAIPCCVWLLSLVRFYRRFIYEEPNGTVWAIADDMYISACFGRSLFSGTGFLWYEGAPKVEGISNPLWAAVIGALHKLPGFSEDRLGLYVIGLNALFLICVVLLFARTARSALRVGQRVPRGSALIVSLAAILLLPWCWSLSYWSAEGFEVALLCLITYAGLSLALLPRTAASCLALGLVLAMGFATRMDFALLASAVVLVALSHRRGSRMLLLWTALFSIALIGALLAWRHDYYGDWLPNTYYLKTTGWRLSSRLQRGLRQNQALLLTAWLAYLPLLLPAVRRNLGARLPCVAAGLCAFGLAVLYSCYVGGDAWSLFAGYDRHTAAAAVLLCWSLCLLIAAAARTWHMRALCSVWCLLLVAAPVLAQNGLNQVQRGLIAAESPMRGNERDWIRYGKRFREVSEPGARIAICPAGAIVYFSHRGGVDLLGKVEPIVAHLRANESRPRNMACWRNAPGHNKGDDPRVYEERAPEFARGKLPRSQRQLYFHFKYQGSHFFVRKGTDLVKPEFQAHAGR